MLKAKRLEPVRTPTGPPIKNDGFKAAQSRFMESVNRTPTVAGERVDAKSGLAVGSKFLYQYRIREKLADNGITSVYLADDTSNPKLDKPVVIKVLNVTDDIGASRRFHREKMNLIYLKHKNVIKVTVHDTPPEGNPFFVMEYAPGRTLRELYGQGPIPLARVKDILLQLCDVMIRAHKKDIVNCILKPDNIMVADDGTVKILNFESSLESPDTSDVQRLWALAYIMLGMSDNSVSPEVKGDIMRTLKQDRAKMFKNVGDLRAAISKWKVPEASQPGLWLQAAVVLDILLVLGSTVLGAHKPNLQANQRQLSAVSSVVLPSNTSVSEPLPTNEIASIANPSTAYQISLRTDPPGARVYVQYDLEHKGRKLAVRTPCELEIDNKRNESTRIKIMLSGYRKAVLDVTRRDAGDVKIDLIKTKAKTTSDNFGRNLAELERVLAKSR